MAWEIDTGIGLKRKIKCRKVQETHFTSYDIPQTRELSNISTSTITIVGKQTTR